METAAWTALLTVLATIFLMAASSAQIWNYRRRQLALMQKRYAAFSELGADLEAQEMRRKMRGGAWSGYRKFRVAHKVKESGTVFSFYLEPYDRKSVVVHEPGQFLTFRLRVHPEREPMVRCYSISRARAESNQYRISIRHLRAKDGEEDLSRGVVSRYFHDHVEEGSILDVGPPSGNFILREGKGRPVVFLAGGIGVTPLLAMAESMAELHPAQEIRFFYATADGLDAPLLERLREIAAERPAFHLVVCHSHPADGDRKGETYDEAGYIDADLLQRTLPSSNFEYFLCGPPPMMDSLTAGLTKWGVPKDSIHVEMFSPLSVKRASLAVEGATKERDVTFRDAGGAFRWKPQAGSILEQAEANGLSLPSGCRAGNCGTCATPLLEGTFDYISKPGFDPEEGCCLLCIAVPTENVEFA